MKIRHIEARNVFEPDQLSALSALYEETLAVLRTAGGPYADLDEAELSQQVARILIEGAREGISDPGLIQQKVLRRLAERTGCDGAAPAPCTQAARSPSGIA